MSITTEAARALLEDDEFSNFSEIVSLQSEVCPPMAHILRTDGDSYYRKKAAVVLGAIGDATAKKALQDALEHESDVNVRLAIIQAIGEVNDQSLAEQLLPLLDDDDHGIRRYTLMALDKLQNEALIKPIEDYAARETNADLRVDAERILRRQLNTEAGLRTEQEIAEFRDGLDMPESEVAESESLGYDSSAASAEPFEIVTSQGFCVKVPTDYNPAALKRLLKLLAELQ